MALATEVDRSASALSRIETILGDDAGLLQYQCRTIPKEKLHLPGPDFVDRVCAVRSPCARPGQLAAAVRYRSIERHRACLDPPGRPGDRALRRRVVCAEY